MRNNTYALLIFALLSTLLLSGCITDSKTRSFHALDPSFSAALEHERKKNFSTIRTDMAMKGLSIGTPLYIRAFKSEMEMELWAQNPYTGEYKLYKTYPICQKSGSLGPKIKEGDRQTPEGFYDVTPDRMNPHSKFYLSFNIGYPNAYDRAHGHTGSALMVHGACVSAGCLAMNDNNIGEIYLIIDESFKNGVHRIPVHIFPFRMTSDQLALRQNSPWMPFWLDLKKGYDYFEKYHVPPDMGLEHNRYVLNDKKSPETPWKVSSTN